MVVVPATTVPTKIPAFRMRFERGAPEPTGVDMVAALFRMRPRRDSKPFLNIMDPERDGTDCTPLAA
jgi:hypothetical protein